MHPDPPDEENSQRSGLPPREPVPVARPQPLDPPPWQTARLSRRAPADDPTDAPEEAADPRPAASSPAKVPAPPKVTAPPRAPAPDAASAEPPEMDPPPLIAPVVSAASTPTAGPSLRFGRPTPTEPRPAVSVSARPGEPADSGLIRVGMWGAASGGKTTFLAALPVAVLSGSGERGRWTINGATPEASEFLLEMTELLDHDRRFPPGSLAGTPLSWHIFGEPDSGAEPAPRSRRGWFDGLLGQPAAGQPPVEFVLDLQDMPGDWFVMGRDKDEAVKESVLKHLAAADGLLYLFDPIRDAVKEDGDQGNFQFFHGVLEHLMFQLRRDGKLVNGRLPHHVAVCITKFDHPALFSRALKSDWVSTHPDSNQPYVPNRHAGEFFSWLCAQTPGSGADRVRTALKHYFQADRVAYFVCSAIGFRLGPGGRFDPSDYANVITVDGEPRIRDEVRPINVLEPVIGLERRIRTGSW